MKMGYSFFSRLIFPLFLLLSLVAGGFVVHAESSSDPFLSELWYLRSIHADAVSVRSYQKTSIVAVLDAGFDLSHEDLSNQYWTNAEEVLGDHKDNDHNGYEDDVHGWDFIDNDPDPSPDISDPSASDIVASHGTLLAGIIAAESSNGKGIRGIATHAKIMPLRILNAKGKGTTAGVRDAIRYAVFNGADVINLSLASVQPDDLLQETIEWAVGQGVVVVAAVGNEQRDLDTDPTFPACFDTRIGVNRVIGVAALAEDGTRASFSNAGSNCVDISAPGVDIFGAVYHDETKLLYSTSYGSPFEGTSLAAPMVAAAAAEIRSVYPFLTPEQIRLSLMLSADPLTRVSTKERPKLGAGLLNVQRALEVAQVFAGSPVHEMTVPTGEQHPSGSLVVAQGAGTVPMVARVSPAGVLQASFLAYDDRFRGGVRVAVGDVTGNGHEEIVTGAGPGGGPHVRIFDSTGRVLEQFFAFDPSDRHGIYVTTGDVNGDGVEEILVTRDFGGTGEVRIFSWRGTPIGSFYPFGRTIQPVFVSVGNFDMDSGPEIIASLGGTDARHVVKIFEGDGKYLRDFSVQTTASVGLRVATLQQKDSDQDLIVVSSVQGGSSFVAIYSALGTYASSSFVFPQAFSGGVQVAVGDPRQTGFPALFVAPTSAGGPQVRVFDPEFRLLGGFFVFDSKDRSGLSIAMWNP